MITPLADSKSRCEPNQRMIVSSEKGCTHRANNVLLSAVRHFQIDGDVVRDPQILKCDYLLLNDDVKTAYFIELKGSDIQHAIEQLECTLRIFKHELFEYRALFRVVYKTGSTHSVRSSAVTEWKKKHRDAVIKQSQYEEDI
jgi:hypothetical protein